MQGWNEKKHKTDVASRPGSVFAILDLENPRKCVECRKNTGVGVGAVDDDGNLWKKCREVWRSRKKTVVGNPLPGRPTSSWLHWGYVIACMQLHQSVLTCAHGQRWPPRKVGTKTDTKQTLRHVRAVFLRFSTWKTLENASSIGKIRELAWVLWMVMPTCGKSVAAFDGVGKKRSWEPPPRQTDK